MIEFVILHGSSAVGKTYMMNALVQEDPLLGSIEIDDCKFWQDYEAVMTPAELDFISPPPAEADFAEFLRLFGDGKTNRARCIAFLVSRIRALLRPEAGAAPSAALVLVTVGALPPPPRPGEPSVYDWLASRLPLRFHHVLIEIPEAQHLDQMARRGRLHLRDEILANNSQRLERRDLHDSVISDLDGLRAIVKARQAAHPAAPAPAQPAAPPARQDIPMKLRTQKNTRKDLKYVQIFGERNSGTNHLKRLVSEHMKEPGNFYGSYATKKNPVNMAKMFGYKHYYVRPKLMEQPEQHETLFLVLYKNPYTWVRSTLAKPYHFRACLEGKTLTDLPKLPLVGYDVHGRIIPDLHPVTGEPVNIFDLRKYKIQNWEGLVDLVDNVVYVNYETLLLHPTEIIQSIVSDFPSLFTTTTIPHQEPDMKYVEKYVTPEPFSEAELAAMDGAIDWDTEARIGYARGNLFIPL